jgi:hypothetical protein
MNVEKWTGWLRLIPLRSGINLPLDLYFHRLLDQSRLQSHDIAAGDQFSGQLVPRRNVHAEFDPTDIQKFE